MAGPSFYIVLVLRPNAVFHGIMSELPPIHLWSVSADLSPLAGGHRACVYRTLGLASNLVFKSTTREQDALAWLRPVLKAARNAGFAVPEQRPSRHNRLVEQGWTCETYLEGEAYPASDMPALAPLITRFHTQSSALPQRPGFLSSQQLVTKPSGGEIDFSAMLPGLAAKIKSAFAAIGSAKTTVIHSDLHAGNLLRLPNGQPALIDWDEARRDHPFFDLQWGNDLSAAQTRACLAWEIACCWTKEPERARQLAAKL